jgi:hypothetical protein
MWLQYDASPASALRGPRDVVNSRPSAVESTVSAFAVAADERDTVQVEHRDPPDAEGCGLRSLRVLHERRLRDDLRSRRR